MRVLLTNNTLAFRSGTELYVRDVAVELMRRGHEPVVYSTHLGEIAEEIRSATVPVISSLEMLGEPPDIIHAHHNYEAVAAMVQFPRVPAVSFCHGWTPWEETPLVFPQVRRYVGVSEVCRERLIAEGGISPCRIEILPNFFDAKLFPQRDPLPRSPRRALSFSNDMGEQTGLAVLRKACRRCGIELEAIGKAAGRPNRRPGETLTKYDLVFARGRCAIEAMAVGAAVVLCDIDRLGPMVASDNFCKLRLMNFASRALSEPFTEEALMQAIRKYDPVDASAVSAMVRRECELKPAVDRILGVYETALREAQDAGPAPQSECNRALVRHLEQSAPHYKSSLLTQEKLQWMRKERLLKLEIAAMRGSASWRWSQRVLRNALVKRVLGGVIQRVAQKAQRAVASRTG
ncbi:MAG TPA: glycosyltransferase family 4 protein [Bryobacteraceae bacterium]|nr:glycosyltransferase family 4 protein [Bryobacteraceae bacterium]